VAEAVLHGLIIGGAYVAGVCVGGWIFKAALNWWLRKKGHIE
jgi:hypothetical protein